MRPGRTLGAHDRLMVDDSVSEWRNPEHALDYLARADTFPHRAEGEGVLLDHVPRDARRILDLGTGDGRLLALLRMDRPDSVGVGLDVSEPMIEAARARFADQASVEFVRHDLAEPMPDLGSFDAVVSCFAIQHVHDTRKRTLYAEAFDRLAPGGVFCNLEHVASPTARLHRAFYQALGYARTSRILPITCSTWRRSLAGLCLRGPSRLPAEMPPVKNVGEPCSGEPHARIDGGREETSVSRLRPRDTRRLSPTRPASLLGLGGGRRGQSRKIAISTTMGEAGRNLPSRR